MKTSPVRVFVDPITFVGRAIVVGLLLATSIPGLAQHDTTGLLVQ